MSYKIEQNKDKHYIITKDGQVQTILSDWLKYRSFKCSNLTVRTNAGSLVRFLKTIEIEGIDYLKVDEDTMSQYIRGLLDKGFSYNTLKKEVCILEKFYKWLNDSNIVEHRLIWFKRSPKRFMVLPPYDSKHTIINKKRFTEDEVYRFIRAIPKLRDKLMYSFYVILGIRKLPLIHITIDGFDAEKGILKYSELKTRQEQVRIIPPNAVAMLQKYIQIERPTPVEGMNMLFLSDTGKKYSIEQFHKNLRKTADEMGMDRGIINVGRAYVMIRTYNPQLEVTNPIWMHKSLLMLNRHAHPHMTEMNNQKLFLKLSEDEVAVGKEGDDEE